MIDVLYAPQFGPKYHDLARLSNRHPSRQNPAPKRSYKAANGPVFQIKSKAQVIGRTHPSSGDKYGVPKGASCRSFRSIVQIKIHIKIAS
ncbi:hypothetical protein PG994_013837 [Apiospora phragmitis]|uniref:Uncharacterized protein n=1 Tax=Apiospora phragmitis TaxID=2905665 RepID=A0ABR1T2K6_9PEZI